MPPSLKLAERRLAGIAGMKISHLDGAVMMSVSEQAQWKIFDLNGHVVATASGKDFFWKTRGQSGIYIVKAVGRKQSYSRKITVR